MVSPLNGHCMKKISVPCFSYLVVLVLMLKVTQCCESLCVEYWPKTLGKDGNLKVKPKKNNTSHNSVLMAHHNTK